MSKMLVKRKKGVSISFFLHRNNKRARRTLAREGERALQREERKLKQSSPCFLNKKGGFAVGISLFCNKAAACC